MKLLLQEWCGEHCNWKFSIATRWLGRSMLLNKLCCQVNVSENLNADEIMRSWMLISMKWYTCCAQKQTYFCCTLESLECWPWLNVVLVKTYFCCASESLDVNHDWLSTYFCWASSLLTPSTAFQASHFAPPLDKGYLDHAPDDQESMKSLRLVSCDGCEWQLTSGRAFLVFQCSRRPQWPESNLRVFILLLQSGALMLRGIQVFTCL